MTYGGDCRICRISSGVSTGIGDAALWAKLFKADTPVRKALEIHLVRGVIDDPDDFDP